jgi:membrane-associated phospholipid phosphatase
MNDIDGASSPHAATKWPRSESLLESAAATGRSALRNLDGLDQSAYRMIADVRTPYLDTMLARLSDAADHSKLWLATAGVLATVGGRNGRTAALTGVASIGLASALANILVKGVLPRRRPDRARAALPQARLVRMPASRSFPSGHSASAFAFASAVGPAVPRLSPALHVAAVAVAYSRVHTGVHYPGDVIMGALLGTASAAIVRRTVGHRSSSRRGPWPLKYRYLP